MIGDYNWGLKTKGNLNFLTKVLLAFQAIQAKKAYLNVEKNSYHFHETDFAVPDSKLVKETIEFLKDTHQEFLINHCYRTYIFGNIIGKNESVKFDPELLAISALMHDVGLTKNHCYIHENCNCFAIEGAIETGIFLEKQNLEKQKIKIIQDAISLHLNIKIPADLPEAYLLNKGAAVDVIGQDLKKFDSSFLSQTLERYPRLNFKFEINQLMSNQGKKRPNSRISFLYKNGFGTMIKKANFEE